MSDDTLTDQLRAAARSPAGLRFVDKREAETRLSYAEVLARAERCAAGLAGLGVRVGDRVALILPTSPDFFDAFFGVLLAGGVPVPLYPPVRMGRLDEYHQRSGQMLGHVGARLILTDARIRRVLGRTVELAPRGAECRLVEDVVRAGRSGSPAVLVGPDAPALIQFSSGSTAAPKPVVLTHRQIIANVRAIVGAIDAAFPESPELPHAGASWLPLYHDMGLIGCVFPAISGLRELTLIPPELFLSRPGVWLRAIARARATISPAPNFAYGLCADRVTDGELEGVDLSCWQMALNGAEPVSPETLERFIARFSRFGFRPEALTPVYGLSEAALAVTFSPPTRRFRVERFDAEQLASTGVAVPSETGRGLVSVGTALPGFQVRIVDDDGQPLPERRAGRVWVRGPSVMSGYFEQAVLTQQILRDGWLDTGDVGFLSEGELYLHGRAKDLLIVRGRKYAPQEIEQLLDEVPGVRAGCTAALSYAPPGADTERVVVLVERARSAEQDDAALEKAVRSRIAEGSGLAIDAVHILEPGTLPRTSSGKIRRRDALARFLGDQLDAPRPVTPLRMAGELVRSAAAFARSTLAR